MRSQPVRLLVLAAAVSACAEAADLPSPGEATSRRASLTAAELDAIYLGGTIYTGDPQRPVAHAMATRGGRIVGFDDDVWGWMSSNDFPWQRVRPIGNRVMIPGFVDAHNHVFQRINLLEEPDAEQINDELASLEQRLMRNGITAQGLLSVGPGLLSLLEEYDLDRGLRVRTSVYMNYNGVCDLATSAWYITHTPVSDPLLRLRQPGIKVFADGGHCEYDDTAGHHEKWPALSFPGYTPAQHVPADGETYLDGVELRNLISVAQERGWQLAIHVIGDRARGDVLAAFREMLQGVNPLHHRIEHNTVVRPDQIAAYGPSGVVPVVWGYEKTCNEAPSLPEQSWHGTLGPSRASWYHPWRDMMTAPGNEGLHMAWHSDVLLSTPLDDGLWNPMASFQGLVMGAERAPDGHLCLPTADVVSQRVSRTTALRMMTLESAYALGLDKVTGSLEVGKLADFVILSDDPMTAPAATLDRIRVLATAIEDEVVYCHPDAGAACVATP